MTQQDLRRRFKFAWSENKLSGYFVQRTKIYPLKKTVFSKLIGFYDIFEIKIINKSIPKSQNVIQMVIFGIFVQMLFRVKVTMRTLKENIFDNRKNDRKNF